MTKIVSPGIGKQIFEAAPQPKMGDREDFGKEKQKMLNYGWTEQLMECVGGNTDGIAAICGCFLGAYYGANAIPDKYNIIENRSEMLKLSLKIK